jgi:hypothetical protein
MNNTGFFLQIEKNFYFLSKKAGTQQNVPHVIYVIKHGSDFLYENILRKAGFWLFK